MLAAVVAVAPGAAALFELLPWLLLPWLLLQVLALLTCAAARMQGPGDVPVLKQRRLRARREEDMQNCIASFQWDKGSCAAHCVTEKVAATICRARPDAAIRRVRRCTPHHGRWLHLDELSPGCWQGSQKHGHALSHHPIRMLRSAHDIELILTRPNLAQSSEAKVCLSASVSCLLKDSGSPMTASSPIASGLCRRCSRSCW